VTRHASDPAAPWRAAATFGRLVAQGLLSAREADAALAAAPAPGVDAAGWATRRRWRLLAAAAGWSRARRDAARAVRAALAPLLAARAPRASLEAAAAGADRRRALTEAERAALLRAEVARALAGGLGSATR
jgi:hypothetical protein